MAEKISLVVFWTAMILCASSVLTLIWFEHAIPERIAPTLFIVGLASFLLWAPLVTYRFLGKM